VIGRRIPLPGTTNLRDVGGYPAGGGYVIRPGKLYRSDALLSYDETSLPDQYRALGIKTVIDLRTPAESAKTPSAWPTATGAATVTIPIPDGAEGTNTTLMGMVLRGEITKFTAEDLGDFYIGSLERRAPLYGQVIRTLAEPGRMPALVHCSAGKDRTGLVIALVLSVLETPREVILADYELTGQFRPNRVHVFADQLRAVNVRPDDVRAMFETPTQAMVAALDYLDERHGSVERYLTGAAGVAESDLEMLKRTLRVSVA